MRPQTEQSAEILPPFGQALLTDAHQLDEDFALAPALTAEISHDLLQTLMQLISSSAQGRGGCGALLADARDEMKGFFGHQWPAPTLPVYVIRQQRTPEHASPGLRPLGLLCLLISSVNIVVVHQPVATDG